MNDIQKDLMQFVTRSLLDGDASDLTPETPLFELRILDSITVVELYVFVEQRFGVKLDNGKTSPEEYATIGALSRLIERRRAAGGAATSTA